MRNFNKLLKNKYLLGLVGILLVGLIVRLFVFGAVTVGHSQDSYWFITLGENFINNFRIELSANQPYDLSQPLHPMLLGITSLFFNDLYFNGKLFSLIIGLLVIPATYFFWRRLENRKTALFATFFVAFAALSLKYSVAIREDSLYTLLLILSLFFIYRIKEDFRKMPIAAMFITLASLSRWEGYLLIPTVFISLIYWNRKSIFKKNGLDLRIFSNKYFLLSVIIVFIPLFFWSLRSFNLCDCGMKGFIPSYSYQQQLSGSGGGAGISYLTGIFSLIHWYFLIFIIIGILSSFSKFKKFFPIYLYLAFSLFIHMAFRGNPEQVVYILPLLYGFLGFLIVDFGKRLSNKKIKMFHIIVLIFMSLFLYVNISEGYSETREWGTRNEVIESAMEWVNENVDPSEKILVGDVLVYSYFTENELVSMSSASYWMNSYSQQNPHEDPLVPYVVFLYSNGVNYAVAYDSTMSWFYGRTENFAKNFGQRAYNFEEGVLVLTPIKEFKDNGESLILYEIQVNGGS